MAIERQENWLGQQRVDVQHLRALESGVAYDFDTLAGQLLAGGRALVASGFQVVVSPSPLGHQASSLQVSTAGSVLLHPLASESGTAFRAPADRALETLSSSNARVEGSFTAGAVNYVGVDLRRAADSSTSDVVQFLDPDTNAESAKEVPLARTLDYVIVVSQQDFSSTPWVAPVALITTDSGNNVTAVTDARALLFRLASGGSVPSTTSTYSWPNGRLPATNSLDFSSGDKAIGSLKDWLDAASTRLWELGGGERWYSPTDDRNVQMVRSGATFTGGEYFEWDGTNLHWKGLSFTFDNSTAVTNTVSNQLTDSPGLTDLTDGQCVYVDVDRATNAAALTAGKGSLATLGTPTIPGSRFVIAWRSGTSIFTRNSYFAVGTAFAVATTTALGVVKLSATAGAPAAPVVPSIDGSGRAQAGGLTRGGVGAGQLTVGPGANDTGVQISKAGALTEVMGLLQVDDLISGVGRDLLYKFIFGVGSDSAQVFDGSATILGLAPSSNVYTLTRDIFCTDLTITGANTAINTAGFRIFVNGTLTFPASANPSTGRIFNNGTAGVGITQGAAGGKGTVGGGGAGGGGANFGGSASNGTGTSNSQGNNGGDSGFTITPQTGGVATQLTAIQGTLRQLHAAIMGHVCGVTTISGTFTDSGADTVTVSFPVSWAQVQGGAGGGGGNSGTIGQAGGGGGGGGGVTFVAARLVVFGQGNVVDYITAKGGRGGDSTGGNGGGGGGGGGGVVIYISCTTNLSNALQVQGGVAGATTGTWTVGTPGGTGKIFAFIV